MWLHTSFVNQLRCAIRSGHGPFTCWNKHWRQGWCGVIHKGEKRNRETYLQRAIWNKTRATYHLPVLQKSASYNSYYIIWNETCELLSIPLCYNINKVPSLPCGPFAITASASMKFPCWALTPAVWSLGRNEIARRGTPIMFLQDHGWQWKGKQNMSSEVWVTLQLCLWLAANLAQLLQLQLSVPQFPSSLSHCLVPSASLLATIKLWLMSHLNTPLLTAVGNTTRTGPH